MTLHYSDASHVLSHRRVKDMLSCSPAPQERRLIHLRLKADCAAQTPAAPETSKSVGHGACGGQAFVTRLWKWRQYCAAIPMMIRS